MGYKNMGYKVDIALVIDATGSMGPIIEELKENPFIFSERLTEIMDGYYKPLDKLRMRIIDFADFLSEGKEAIHASRFYDIPAEKEQFASRMREIQYDGRGSDEPENALEALWTAMQSDWVDLHGATRGYHIII